MRPSVGECLHPLAMALEPRRRRHRSYYLAFGTGTHAASPNLAPWNVTFCAMSVGHNEAKVPASRLRTSATVAACRR